MNDDTLLRDSLRHIAEDEPVDESAAWTRISAGIEADRRRRRLTTVVVGGAGLAAAAAAAGLVVLAVAEDPRPEAVEIGPAATDSTAPATSDSTPETSTTDTSQPELENVPAPVPTSGPVPEHPLLVIRQNEGVTSLYVLDGDSGEVLGTPAIETAFSISDPVITRDGLIAYTRETGDSHRIELLEWGSTEPAVFGDLDEAQSPAFSPDGSTFAYVEQGVTIPQASIVFVDVDSSQEIRRITWRDDETDFFRTNGNLHDLEWSPDGSRLLFISSYEGAEALVVDVDAESLSEAELAVGADVLSVSWSGADSVVALGWCCYPEYDRPRQGYAGPVGAAEPAFGDEQFDDIDAGSNGEVALVAGGGLTIVGTDAQRRDVIGTESGIVSGDLF
jgi:dipeptidyl aminopeptidase/acylaminoacyl peptidase